jgi:hypothetical protein
MQIEDGLCDAVVRGNSFCELNTLVIVWNKKTVNILRGMWAGDYTSRHGFRQMCTSFWANVVVFEEDWCRRWSLPSAIKEEIRIHANSECYIVFSRKVAVCEFLAIYGDFLSAESSIVKAIKDIRHFAWFVLVIMAVGECFDSLGIAEKSLEAWNDG